MSSSFQRLSDSSVYDTMDEFYGSMGQDSWNLDRVPSYVTTNSFISNKYAEVVAAFTSDLCRKHPLGFHLDVIDAGTGAGGLAYGLYLALRRRCDTKRLVLNGSIRIVLADYSRSVISGLM